MPPNLDPAEVPTLIEDVALSEVVRHLQDEVARLTHRVSEHIRVVPGVVCVLGNHPLEERRPRHDPVPSTINAAVGAQQAAEVGGRARRNRQHCCQREHRK